MPSAASSPPSPRPHGPATAADRTLHAVPSIRAGGVGASGQFTIIEVHAAPDGSPFAQPALDAGAKVRALAADPATGLLWAGAGKRLLA